MTGRIPEQRRTPPTSPPPSTPVAGQEPSEPWQPGAMTLVIYFGGAALLISLVTIAGLAWAEKPTPDALGAFPGLALTGILALLAKR